MKLVNSFCHDKGSGTLPFSLFLILLISLLASIILSLSLAYLKTVQLIHQKEQLRLNAKSGINLFSDSLFIFNKEYSFQLPDSSNVLLKKKPYGFYSKIISASSNKNLSIAYEFINAGLFENNSSIAINILDRNIDLTLAKKSTIKGNILFGNKRFQKAQWKGIPYSGNLDGNLIQSPDTLLFELPNSGFQTFIEDLMNQKQHAQSFSSDFQQQLNTDERDTVSFNSAIEWLNIFDKVDTLKNKVIFLNDQLLINSKLQISNCILFGNTKMKFEQISFFNTIVIANTIELNDCTSSLSQFIAFEDIIVNRSKLLKHSLISTIGLLTENEINGKIELNGSQINGLVILPRFTLKEKHAFTTDKRMLLTDNESIIEGFIFNTANTNFGGTIQGMIATKNFYLSDGSTTFINWINQGKYSFSSSFVVPYSFSHSKPLILNEYQIQ